MRVLFYVTALYKDLLSDLAQILNQNHDVRILATDNDVKFYLKKLIDEEIKIETIDDYRKQVEEILNKLDNTEQEKLFLNKEKYYNKNFSALISQERYIERGHIHTIDYKIFHKNQLLNREKKFEYIFQNLSIFEKILDNIKPELIFSFQRLIYLDLVCEKRAVKYLNFAPAKFKKLYFVCDEYRNNSSILSKSIKDNLTSNLDENYDESSFDQIWYGKSNQDFIYSITSTFKRIVVLIIKSMKHFIIKKIYKNQINRVGLMVWILNEIKGYFNFRKYKNLSKNFDQIKKLNYIYFPLHMEPEKVLQSFALEFNNSLEIISWISKSLPSNYYLVLKEHPKAFSMRDTKFYDKIASISNVLLVNQDSNSWDLIRNSSFVAGINGTSILESVYLKKRVICYVDKMFFNNFTSISYCSNYEDTKLRISDYINKPLDEELLNKNKNALLKSFLDNSFEIDEINSIKHKTISLKKETYKRMIDHINLFLDEEKL